MEQLLAYLNSVCPLSESLRERLLDVTRRRVVQRKEFLLRAGEVCRHLYFIETGLLRCYYLKDEVEVTEWLMKEDDLVTAVESFYPQAESQVYIHALEKCVLYYISFEDFETVINEEPAFVYIAWKLTVKYLIFYTQQLHNIRLLSARERFQFLKDTNPDLIRRVPVTYLASYLDMLRETLSRTRDIS
jgi:CRP-like cAMP-binding protein